MKGRPADWVKNARKGREAWQESCGDFNIGDLALNDRTAEKWCHETGTLEKYGLLGFSVTSCYDSDPIPFDTILTNRNSLPEDCEFRGLSNTYPRLPDDIIDEDEGQVMKADDLIDQ